MSNMEVSGMLKENTALVTDTKFQKFKKYAWLVLLSFGFMYLFFYNGRQNINLVMTQMAEDLGSSTAALGAVSSALFWCYAFGQLINGRLGAFFGYKRFMIIGVLGSALLNVAISFQHSIPVIAVLWGLNGFFQSMVWSNGLGVVNKWWPAKNRGFATGLTTFFSGMAQVTTYLSVLICLQLNPEWSWRAAFRFPLLPLLLSLIAFVCFFKNSPIWKASALLVPIRRILRSSVQKCGSRHSANADENAITMNNGSFTGFQICDSRTGNPAFS